MFIERIANSAGIKSAANFAVSSVAYLTVHEISGIVSPKKDNSKVL